MKNCNECDLGGKYHSSHCPLATAEDNRKEDIDNNAVDYEQEHSGYSEMPAQADPR